MFDLIIKGADIIDGNGGDRRRGDLAVRAGRIAAVERSIDGETARVIDGRGQVLTPGFIDLHVHTDAYHLTDPDSAIRIRQGVCLDVAGNCGESPAPASQAWSAAVAAQFGIDPPAAFGQSFADYAAAVDRVRPAMRVMSHVGHTALRVRAMGYAAGPPSPEALQGMKRELEAALEAGAAGMSTGLYYPPSGFAQKAELAALARILASRNRLHVSHIRNEAEGLLASLEEIADIGLASGAASHVSHLKAAGRKNWNKADEVIAFFESARSRGLDLTCDVYPYHRSSTVLLSLIPPWAQEGGVPGLLARLERPAERDRIIGQMRDGLPGWENTLHNAGFDGIVVAYAAAPENKYLEGRTLTAGAEAAGADPYDFVLNLIASDKGATAIISESMSEETVARFIALPFAMIGSDGTPRDGTPHPRLYGTFPRVIRRFVRELNVLTLEEAVSKMTGLPAQRLGLTDAGLVRKGYRADLTMFDPERFADTATFENPRQFPEGLTAVLVGGEVVLEKSELTGARPGGFVRAGREAAS